MSDAEPFRYTDVDGEELVIEPYVLGPGTAYLHSSEVRVPAHELAGVCRALYRAAGQPEPDLPEIADPGAVEDLAKVIYGHQHCGNGRPEPDDIARDEARAILAAGYSRSSDPAETDEVISALRDKLAGPGTAS